MVCMSFFYMHFFFMPVSVTVTMIPEFVHFFQQTHRVQKGDAGQVFVTGLVDLCWYINTNIDPRD